MERDERVPSQVHDVLWIYANNEQNNYHIKRGRSGKWLIFEYKDEMDATWQKIKEGTRNGIFGTKSKVATAKQNPKASNEDFKVICIYTADFDNKEDINRIEKSIRSIGIENKLIYKLNDHVPQFPEDFSQKFRYAETYYQTLKWLDTHTDNKYIDLIGFSLSGKKRFSFQRLDLDPNEFQSKILTLSRIGFYIENFNKIETGKIIFSE